MRYDPVQLKAVTLAKRILQFLGLLAASWCLMTFTHEFGHILGGWFSGATLTSADLLPWHLPYSFFDPDPHPLVTLWCGPIFGVAVPVTIALAVRRDWMWLMAYFCVLANGLYLAVAWYAGDDQLDTPKLLENGAHPVSIAFYCLLTISVGYWGFRRSCLRFFSNDPPDPSGHSDAVSRE